MDASRPDKVAKYRQQMSILEAKFHLVEAAQHLEELAADEDRR
jgi:hypothetical protein